MLPADHPVVQALERKHMSVTDDIVEEIVNWCKSEGETVFSREIIKDDFLENYATKLTDEIIAKLEPKGISVGP